MLPHRHLNRGRDRLRAPVVDGHCRQLVHAGRLERFREHRRDIRLVLCDLTMPHMDGWQTLAALHLLDRRCRSS